MKNQDINKQVKSLQLILAESSMIMKILHTAKKLNLPNWYLGAGCICQTVWNSIVGNPIDKFIKDYDLVYFDDQDLSDSMEKENEKRIITKLALSEVEIDVKNEARVHLWYPQKFGKSIDPYQSCEEAINTWPTTASSVGVRLNKGNELIVYAPYGLNDMFSMIVRANKTQITKDIY